MKRLFAVKNSKGKIISDYFSNKMEAKKERDRLNEEFSESFYITRGPDHIGPHGYHNPQNKNKRIV